MAKSVGVIDVHAKYGEVFRLPEYDNLRRVSHWPDDVVEYERIANPTPSYTLEDSFAELLTIFDFERDQ